MVTTIAKPVLGLQSVERVLMSWNGIPVPCPLGERFIGLLMSFTECNGHPYLMKKYLFIGVLLFREMFYFFALSTSYHVLYIDFYQSEPDSYDPRLLQLVLIR